MSVLTSAAVLDLWEAGLAMTPAARAGLLLRATEDGDGSDWPVGRRNVALLRHYCDAGWAAEALADCPGCGEVLELTVEPAALRGAETDRVVTVTGAGYTVRARLPTVRDVAGVVPAGDLEEARWFLLECCVVGAEHHGRRVAVRDLPEHLVGLVEDALDEADPAADIRVPLSCPECGVAWSETLDPVRFAWSAVESSAQRLATDVHTLAQALGWSEQEILALSPFRRHLYLSAVDR